MQKSERGRLSQKRGVEAEEKVCAWLLLQGFEIKARRYKTKQGEIDIIASKNDTLVFCEVKARKTLDEAAFSLSQKQIARLLATAEDYLAAHPHASNCRFDVFLIAANGQMHHIENAIEG